MPNWCTNIMIVKGNDVEEFDNDFHGLPAYATKGDDKKRCFNAIVEQPSDNELEDVLNENENLVFSLLNSNYEISPQRSWRISMWGTKWDIYSDDIKIREANLLDDKNVYYKYTFHTAWSPPIAFVKNASKKYPDLKFILKYHEVNMGVLGKAVVKDGEILKDIFDDSNEEELKELENDEDLKPIFEAYYQEVK